jgi:hypothetical protein
MRKEIIMTRRILSRILLVVVAIFGLFVLSGVLLAQGNSETAFERVKAVQERHTDTLMGIKGVVGTAVGLDEANGHVVIVLVEKEGLAGIPNNLGGVPVRPVVTGKIYALPKGGNGGAAKPPQPPVDRTARFERPVPIGISTGHPAITAGTIGCRVKDAAGNVYALSNNHVYANENDATIGDAVIQPGTYDGGRSPADNIGTLADFEPLNFNGSNNTIDAAIALSSPDQLGNATPSDGYGTPKSATASALLNVNAPVKKYGRTTGLTKGKISAVNATVDVGYGPGKTARFVGQIIITPGTFSAGGDSGSLVVLDAGKGRNPSDDRKPVGLLFAGSSMHTIACPINPVLNRFGVSVDGE